MKLCCLVVDCPQKKMTVIEIDLNDCAVPAFDVLSCLRGVPRLVSSPCYTQRAFFTQGTMETVRDAIACSPEFMSCSTFDPWEGVSCGDRSTFVEKYSPAFNTYTSRKKSDVAKNCIVQVGSHDTSAVWIPGVQVLLVVAILLVPLCCQGLRLLLHRPDLVLTLGL